MYVNIDYGKNFNSDKNIIAAFSRLKDITKNTICNLEKKSLKIKIFFLKNNKIIQNLSLFLY